MDMTYIRKQIARYQAAITPEQQDDCLYRIGTNAEILAPGEQIDDSNRWKVLDLIASLVASLR